MIPIVLLIAILILTLAGLYARARRPQIDAREQYREDFFAAAKVLTSRPETPESVRRMIGFIAERIGDRHAPYKLLAFLVHGDARHAASNPGRRIRQVRADARAMPVDLQEQFGRAMAAGVMAITLNSLLVGWLLRRMAMYPVYKRDERGYDGTEDASLIASGWACAQVP